MENTVTHMIIIQRAIDHATVAQDATAADAHHLGALSPIFAADILILPEFRAVHAKPGDIAGILYQAADQEGIDALLVSAKDELEDVKAKSAPTSARIAKIRAHRKAALRRYEYVTLLMAKAFFEGLELLKMTPDLGVFKPPKGDAVFWHWALTSGSHRLQPWSEFEQPKEVETGEDFSDTDSEFAVAGGHDSLDEPMGSRLPHEIYRAPVFGIKAFEVCGPSSLESADNPFIATEHTSKTFVELQQLKDAAQRQLYRHKIIKHEGRLMPLSFDDDAEQVKQAAELVENWVGAESDSEAEEDAPWSWQVNKSRIRSLMGEPDIIVSIVQHPPAIKQNTGREMTKKEAEAEDARAIAEAVREMRPIADMEHAEGLKHGTLLALRNDPFPSGMKSRVRATAAQHAVEDEAPERRTRHARPKGALEMPTQQDPPFRVSDEDHVMPPLRGPEATVDEQNLQILAAAASNVGDLDADDIISRFCLRVHDRSAGLMSYENGLHNPGEGINHDEGLPMMSGALPTSTSADSSGSPAGLGVPQVDLGGAPTAAARTRARRQRVVRQLPQTQGSRRSTRQQVTATSDQGAAPSGNTASPLAQTAARQASSFLQSPDMAQQVALAKAAELTIKLAAGSSAIVVLSVDSQYHISRDGHVSVSTTMSTGPASFSSSPNIQQYTGVERKMVVALLREGLTNQQLADHFNQRCRKGKVQCTAQDLLGVVQSEMESIRSRISTLQGEVEQRQRTRVRRQKKRTKVESGLVGAIEESGVETTEGGREFASAGATHGGAAFSPRSRTDGKVGSPEVEHTHHQLSSSSRLPTTPKQRGCRKRMLADMAESPASTPAKRLRMDAETPNIMASASKSVSATSAAPTADAYSQ
ncbi:hypothetical protein LTR85_011269 [Meristemomyces frigidus]|nr:hypothetical protein LTR85_011269 [Meristemomyces frigidus]